MLKKCDGRTIGRTDKRTDEQTDLCIELRYAVCATNKSKYNCQILCLNPASSIYYLCFTTPERLMPS